MPSPCPQLRGLPLCPRASPVTQFCLLIGFGILPAAQFFLPQLPRAVPFTLAGFQLTAPTADLSSYAIFAAVLPALLPVSCRFLLGWIALCRNPTAAPLPHLAVMVWFTVGLVAAPFARPHLRTLPPAAAPFAVHGFTHVG